MTGPKRTGTAGNGDASTRGVLKEALITGIALTIPLAITLFILAFVAGFVASQMQPLVSLIANTFGIGSTLAILALQIATLLGTVVVLILVGLAAKTTPGRRAERTVDGVIESIPGVGAVYSSFNEMSELLLDSESQSFKEVVLVEYPTQGSYSLAFLTAETPDMILDSTGHEGMRTVFMPMAPNPFMGGFVMYVAEERIYDVDLSVEEGIQAIVTSGVAVMHEPPEAVPDQPDGPLSEDGTPEPA